MPADTRKRPRFQLRADCMVQTDDGRLLATKTLDGSWDGLRVEGCGEARLGERVQVSLRIPRTTFWIHGRGRVARIVHARRAEDDVAGFGIRLDELHGADRVLLGNTLRREQPVVPRRGSQRDYARTVARILGA